MDQNKNKLTLAENALVTVHVFVTFIYKLLTISLQYLF